MPTNPDVHTVAPSGMMASASQAETILPLIRTSPDDVFGHSGTGGANCLKPESPVGFAPMRKSLSAATLAAAVALLSACAAVPSPSVADQPPSGGTEQAKEK